MLDMERRREELLKELQQIDKVRDDKIRQIDLILDAALGSMLPTFNTNVQSRGEKLIKVAERLRDALQPFDSGVRPAAMPKAPWEN